eukprot:TRINITY_DN20611_c0_g1_i1.p1 TRINITY_DN20611_c0_g1~~TRINITY_DN20611_c0_g1_i1.p1  ORF type:complete len:958 (-),score=120.14 TRINITY_DN20611_c0_g1_i1:11-2884(-)
MATILANGKSYAADERASSGAPDNGVYLNVLREAEKTRGLNKLILRNGADHAALLQIVDERGDELHVLNVCTLLHRLARCLSRHPASLSQRAQAVQQSASWRKLTELLRKHADVCNNMELTNCLWAIATLEMRDEEETVVPLLEQAIVHLDSFDSRNLSLTAWALSKMGCTDRQYAWCRYFAEATLRRLHEFETRDMTMMVWAFATVHWKDEEFLERFCNEIPKRIESYGTQDLGNTLWALATLSYRHEGALAALCQQCFPQAEFFDQQALSISMWSLATLGYKNMNLMHHLTQHATERISTFRSQGMSNITWACAKFQFQQKCLLMTIAEEAIPRVDEFDPQHLAITAWAYATLEFPNRPLLTALCQAATRSMHNFSAQHIANLTWAMATLAHKDEAYLRAMADHAVGLAADFNPQECSNLAWALALLTFRDDRLLAVLSRRSQEIVAEFIPQNLGNSAWAYNRMGYRDEDLMRSLTQQAALMLHECQGQEILDLIEAISTGGYEDIVDPDAWRRVTNWIEMRAGGAEDFVGSSAGMALEWPRLSDFDRALAVQDYQDHLASFNVIGLGYNYTWRVLQKLGVILPSGPELEAWKADATAAAASARNQSDESKNIEAQEGLKACRTVCVHRFSLKREATEETVVCGPVGVASGQPVEAWELGLVAATLKHNRGGDGEFQALQACARACYDSLHLDPLRGEGSQAHGELWLHVTEVPCLSCVGAMAQFRALFPNVALHVSFTLGRRPVSSNSCSNDSCKLTVVEGESTSRPKPSATTSNSRAPLPSPAKPTRSSPAAPRLTPNALYNNNSHTTVVQSHRRQDAAHDRSSSMSNGYHAYSNGSDGPSARFESTSGSRDASASLEKPSVGRPRVEQFGTEQISNGHRHEPSARETYVAGSGRSDDRREQGWQHSSEVTGLAEKSQAEPPGAWAAGSAAAAAPTAAMSGGSAAAPARQSFY